MRTVRCAIYTRKSSDEGLDQTFNSLDAQREACAAYILSQASEGWVALPEVYDDGGLSGGTLDRPALQRLLSEVSAGRVDTIVVYKVDRLTRSLMDFSKLVETFDKAGTSFVSVTQSFNTTTSMGRLTLNMLLSFAQFEREVTAERIRDKIAASKAKGMWMGGIPPLGYEPDGRSLKVVEPHAELVREIFALYLKHCNVRLVAERLEQGGVRSPTRIKAKTGATFGGGPFTRGQIYLILKNPIYIGEIHHKDQVYPGLHQAIIDRDIWERTQQLLATNLQGHRSGARSERPSFLAGRVFDHEGKPLIATHARKGKVRYRYYVSRNLLHGDATVGMRIPARELEAAVANRVAELLADGLAVADLVGLDICATRVGDLLNRSSAVSRQLAGRDHALVRQIVGEVIIRDGRIDISCATGAIAQALQADHADDGPMAITLHADVRLTRSGTAMRLVQGNGAAAEATINPSLINLVVKAGRWWSVLREGQVDITTLAAREGVKAPYMTRVLRLVFLSPAVIDAILAGRQSGGTTVTELTLGHGVPASWDQQKLALLPAS